jgi:hypothetical protein
MPIVRIDLLEGRSSGHEVSSESLADVTTWLSQHLDKAQQDKG